MESAILDSINNQPEFDPSDRRSADDVYADDPAPLVANDVVQLDSRLQDLALREELGIGARTGVKGVIADYKFWQYQEKERAALHKKEAERRLDARTLKSGWMQREIERENKEFRRDQVEDEEDVDELIRQLEDEVEDAPSSTALINGDNDRVAEIYKLTKQIYTQKGQNLIFNSEKKKFGRLITVTEDEFIDELENTSVDLITVVHVFDPSSEVSSKIVRDVVKGLATKYAYIKFIDFSSNGMIDKVGLSCLLMYKGGEIVHTLMRVQDDLFSLEKSGRIDLDEFESYLLRMGVLFEHLIDDV